MYLSIGKVARMTGISRSSLRRWDSDGTLCADYRTKGGHRRYAFNKIRQFLGIEHEKKDVFIYTRVSANKQKADLKRQTDYLIKYAEDNNWDVRVYKDIASGINDLRKGLLRLEFLTGLNSGFHIHCKCVL